FVPSLPSLIDGSNQSAKSAHFSQTRQLFRSGRVGGPRIAWEGRPSGSFRGASDIGPGARPFILEGQTAGCRGCPTAGPWVPGEVLGPMFRAPLWVVCLAPTALLGPARSPLAWSPDGAWLAYTMPEAGAHRPPDSDWFFETGAGPTPAGGRPSACLATRLWATRADRKTSILLAHSPGPLTAPAWRPDGTAPAFGRLLPEAGGGGRVHVPRPR